ncbi:MAG: hypothetical protein A3G75_14390 [Verrucomicrobia bacterium RIFCSPLOWO2_12_FULL_64_8]|nr:MAG: hypothetical protein A3G75_14390 [Verrucomicrobia bacterium RIFCSPLOWO2_12_FULL_64_8]
MPDLLLQGATEPHVGSIDVDLALDTGKLGDGRYAKLVRVLLATRRYRAGRKPKDSYDLCYCLDHFPGGVRQLAKAWRRRTDDPDVRRAIAILREKFATVDGFGPAQVVEFLALADAEAEAIQARRAYQQGQGALVVVSFWGDLSAPFAWLEGAQPAGGAVAKSGLPISGTTYPELFNCPRIDANKRQ